MWLVPGTLDSISPEGDECVCACVCVRGCAHIYNVKGPSPRQSGCLAGHCRQLTFHPCSSFFPEHRTVGCAGPHDLQRCYARVPLPFSFWKKSLGLFPLSKYLTAGAVEITAHLYPVTSLAWDPQKAKPNFAAHVQEPACVCDAGSWSKGQGEESGGRSSTHWPLLS